MRLLLLIALLALAVTAHAGIIGWATSEGRDWEFVQKTGGIRIGTPLNRGGKAVLPVEYDASGLSSITCKPTLQNSGLTVRTIEVTRKGSQLVLRVFTQLIDKRSITGPLHYADLSGIPAGPYEVFYGVAGDQGKRLGQVELK